MGPNSLRTTAPKGDRRRSRSPAGSRKQNKSGSRSQNQYRIRDSSPTDRIRRAQQMMEENKNKWSARDQAWMAKRERRENLDPVERLREDGQELQGEILSDQDMLVTFEYSRSARARCRADRDCLHVLAEVPTETTIIDKFRIRIDGVNDPSFWRPTTHYYHILCFNHMVDLEDLLPAKFQLDRQTTWGLLVRKWFEHKGCINLDKLATYIEAFKAYDEKRLDFSTEWIDWSIRHHPCEADRATCACPPRPEPPEKPVLKDYVTGEEGRCSLDDVVNHPNVDDMPDQRLVNMTGIHERVCPETEEQGEQTGQNLVADRGTGSNTQS